MTCVRKILLRFKFSASNSAPVFKNLRLKFKCRTFDLTAVGTKIQLFDSFDTNPL